MSDDLIDVLREGIATLFVEGEDSYHAADAVLAMPEIVDMLALRRLVGGLTVEQVARALATARSYIRWTLATPNPTDDEKAISQWREPT